MGKRVVIVAAHNSIRESGLAAYAKAVAEALATSAKVARAEPQTFSWAEFPNVDVALWVGIPRDARDAHAVVDTMLAAPRDVVQVLHPEWEGRAAGELGALLAPMELRPLLIALPNNYDEGATIMSGATKWRGGHVPIPLAAQFCSLAPRVSAAFGTREGACYLGRDHPAKGVDELVEIWLEYGTSRRLPKLHLYLYGKSNGRVVSRTSGIEVEALPATLDFDRASIYRRHQFYVSASRHEVGPLAVVEAMSQGCIPVLKNSPGHSHLRERIGTIGLYDDGVELVRYVALVAGNPLRSAHLGIESAAASVAYGGPAAVVESFWRLVDKWTT